MRPARGPKRLVRGFTLVELMIAIVIISVLATLSVYGVRKYVASSKTGEAIQMIGSIKAAQEAFKDETFAYLDVTGTLSTYYPNNLKPGQVKMEWTGTGGTAWSNFRALGVTASGPVLFVYACTAGTAAETPDAPGSDISIANWPSAARGEPWYIVKAKADLQEGGDSTVYVAPSFTNQIFSANEGE